MDNKFCDKVIKEARKRNIIPDIPQLESCPIPAIHKVEWDLTFNCNDYCMHCVTDSGPNCDKFTKLSEAYKIIDNIEKYSLINRIKNVFNENVEYNFESPKTLKKLEKIKKPPRQLNNGLSKSYLECLHGINYTTNLIINNKIKKLNFGRPHIRLSGGEFYTWPNQKNRLETQKKLLKKIREKLPEYDIWILTNGRFAESKEKTNEVISNWSKNLVYEDEKTGKTRICISTDPFHAPPKNSNFKQMLNRIWNSCRKNNFSAPFLYGIPGKEIYYAGRAFDKYNLGELKDFKNNSKCDFNPQKNYVVTTKNLIETDGCTELKGFFVQLSNKVFIPVNNININPDGHLTFCCAQVGDYGDFIKNPEISLKNIICNPISFMMRKKETVIPFLKMVSELDPSIYVKNNKKNAVALSSTCYQMLSGKRKNY